VFRLDQEVLAWCRDVHTHGPDRQARIDELADHLHCLIQSWIDQGFTEKDAFRQATAQLGESKDLVREHVRSWGFRAKARVIFWALMTRNVRTLSKTPPSRARRA
jgi:hypothetical protein